MSTGEKNIVIQKLTLEVSINSSSEAGHSEWLHRLRQWLEDEFLPKLEASLHQALPTDGQTLRFIRLELDLGQFSLQHFEKMAADELPRLLGEAMEWGEVEATEDAPQRVAPPEKELEALIFFLKTGRLPWWKSPVPGAIDEWEQQLSKAFRTGSFAIDKLVTALREKAARQRLVGSFSGRFIKQLMIAIFAEQKVESAEYQDFVLRFKGKSASQKTGKSLANELDWAAVLEQVFGSGEAVFFEEKPAVIEAQRPSVAQSSEAETEPIYIRNAGLVLLHPFLQMLLEELGLAKDGQVTKQERAVQVLHWLSVGRAGAEWELPLNKLLCGLPPEAVVSTKIRLTKREQDECKRLLEAAIRHWSKLGDTSPAGLQGTFLCRDGKLSQKPDGSWCLQVEQRGVDVLLVDLPWGISLVKLPWMPDLLWVEWG